MNSKKTQPYYTLNTSTPVLTVSELDTKFSISIFSNSLLVLLENVNEARILQQLHFWLQQGYGVVLKGYRWIYKSISEWIKDALPDLTMWTARKAVLSLEYKGIIIREKLNKEHYGHNWNFTNQTYYYRINYERLQELISDRLKEMGIERSAKNPSSSDTKTQQPPVVNSLDTGFLECQKTDQNNYQNKLQNHIEKESSTKDSTREQDKEAIDHLGSESEIEINPSASILDPEKDNVPPPVLRNNTKRVTRKSNEYQVTSNEYEAMPQEELVTRNSLPVTRKYDRALGVNPPEYQKDLQQRGFNWLLPGEWAIDGKLDPNFHEWLAQSWLKNYGGNLDETKANVLINFKKDPANIPIRWEQYRSQVLKRYGNASLRMANGVELKEEEQQELIKHSRAIANPLCEEHSVVAKPQASNNLVIGEIINSELLPPSNDDENNHINHNHNNSNNNDYDNTENPLIARDTSDDVTSNNGNYGNDVIKHDTKVTSNTAHKFTAPTKSAPKREVPRTKDGTSAENPDAYQLYQPEQIDEPVNLGDLVARLRKATKGLANKFTMPSAEPPKEQKPLHVMTLKEVNELLQDPVMRVDLLPKLHKSDRFEVFCNELGEVEYVDFAF